MWQARPHGSEQAEGRARRRSHPYPEAETRKSVRHERILDNRRLSAPRLDDLQLRSRRAIVHFLGEAPVEGGDLVGVAPERGSAPAVLANRPDEAWHVACVAEIS